MRFDRLGSGEILVGPESCILTVMSPEWIKMSALQFPCLEMASCLKSICLPCAKEVSASQVWNYLRLRRV